MPRLLTRSPAVYGFTATRHAIPLSIRLGISVSFPRVSFSTLRRVVLSPFVFGSGNNFKMVRMDTVPHPAQVIDFHSNRNNGISVIEERPMCRSIPFSVITNPVGVSVMAKGCDPSPTGVGFFDTCKKSLFGGPKLIHAHKWQSTIRRHCA